MATDAINFILEIFNLDFLMDLRELLGSIVDNLESGRHDVAELAVLLLPELDVRVHELELENVHATRQRRWQFLVEREAVLGLAAELGLHQQVGTEPVRRNAAVDFFGQRDVAQHRKPGPRLFALVFDQPAQFDRAACHHLDRIVNLIPHSAHLVLELHF